MRDHLEVLQGQEKAMGAGLTRQSTLTEFVRAQRERRAADAARDIAGNELLRRAALLRWFDEVTYNAALVKDVTDAPPFANFITRVEIDLTSDRDSTYAIRESYRDQQLNRWRSDRTALQRFSSELVRFYEGRESRIDVFAQLIFADPPKALAEFERLYTEADRSFDLAQCDALLRVLRNRGDMRGLDLTNALNNREQYFQSRSLFADDWLRTAHFLERPEVTKRFEMFFGDSRKWIFRLYASGGAGKTAYLRWLIARYCVPELPARRNRIPVARVDLDFVHMPAINAAPWLLLLPLAEQLNLQLPGAPFFSLLISWSIWLPALKRPVHREHATRLPAFDLNREEELIGAFYSSLGHEPVVVVLDTLEEAVLHHPESVGTLLIVFARIRQNCPGFKVVLSGRYDPFVRADLGARVKDLKRFSEVLPLPPWDRTQCWKYLTSIRHLQPGMPFDSFIRPAGGNPFKVALFADLIDPQRPFTHAELRDLRRVEIEYLVMRVIERIPESDCPLRWLLRYVVVPRQLTEEFVEQVLATHVREAMAASGPEAPDRPAENLPKGAELLRKRSPWPPCDKPFNTSVEWQALLRYAGPSSWISLSDGLPRPQPELLSPMRYLLQEQPIFAPIHRDAAAYFEGLARAEGRDWTEMMCEAIYHQFQLRGSDAAEYWRNCLQQRQAQDGTVRRKLAECLLSGDFLDDRNQPLPHRKTGTILSPLTLAEAYLELGALDVRESLYSRQAGLLERAAKRLETVRALEKEYDFQIDFNGRRALVEAAMEARADPQAAVLILDKVLASGISDPYRPVLLMQRGNLLLKMGNLAGASTDFSVAAVTASLETAPLLPVWRIQTIIAREAFTRDDLETAVHHYEAALSVATPSNISADDMGQLVATLTEIDRSSANWSRAADRLRQVENATGLTFAGLRSQLSLDQYAPADAARYRLESGEPDPRIEALTLALEGQFNLAARLLEEAWKSSARDSEVAARARFEQISLILREIGDYRRARSLLTHVRDLGAYQTNAALLLLELQVRTRNRDAAVQGWRNLRSSKGMGPRQFASVLATGLALELAPGAELQEMLEALAAVQPPSARLPLLKPFLSFEGRPPLAVASPLFDKVLFVPEDAPDYVGRVLLLVEALRYVGDRDRAAVMLKIALGFVGENGILRRKVISALIRLGTIIGEQEILAYGQSLRKDKSQVSILGRLEVAEYWIGRKRHNLARSMLTEPPEPETQYSMRYWFARAFVDQDDRNAKQFLASAKQTAGRLGITLEVEPETAKPAADLFDREHRLEISLVAAGLVKVVFHPPGGPPLDAQVSFDIFDSSATFSLSDPVTLHARMQIYHKAIAKHAEMLKLRMEQRAISAEGMNLRLELGEDDELAAMPWESALHEPFRFVYRCQKGGDITEERLQWFAVRLYKSREVQEPGDVAQIERAERRLGVFADGWRGIETRRNLNGAREECVVAIIKQSTEEERSQKLGAGSSSISLEDLYAGRGVRFQVYDPRTLTPETIQKLFQLVQLVHICLPLTELNGLLQLGSAADTAGSGLSASFLYVLNPALPRPLVLLDPPTPTRPEFWTQQIVWRNVYARQLFQRYSVEAVIAAGLVRDPRVYYRGLLANMAGRSSAGELLRYLTVNHPESGAALYAFDPEIPLL
jgi:tetratricopeptide (TPR) repeat protein